MYEAYLDETGDDGGFPLFAIGGYIVRSDIARLFEDRWSALLAEYHLPYFHMVECAHGNDQFSGVPREKRIEIQTRFIDLIKEMGLGGCVSIVPLQTNQSTDTLYRTCIGNCITVLETCVKYNAPDATDLIVFYERGHTHSFGAHEALKRLKEKGPPEFIRSVAGIDKRASGLVQAADILVWQYAKYVKCIIEGRPIRKDFMSLIENYTMGTITMNRINFGDGPNPSAELNCLIDSRSVGSKIEVANIRTLFSSPPDFAQFAASNDFRRF